MADMRSQGCRMPGFQLTKKSGRDRATNSHVLLERTGIVKIYHGRIYSENFDENWG